MPGLFDNRKTELIFNDYLPSVVAPWIAIQRDGADMCKSTSAEVSNMEFIPGVGWRLQSYHLSPGDAAWQSDPQAGNLSVANGATVATNLFEENVFVQPSLTGVTYDGSVQSAGTPMITAKIPAGTDYSTQTLSVDQAAYPSPSPSEDLVSMDRVYKFATGGTPDIKPWDSLTFGFYAPAAALIGRGTLATFYFAGPAGVDAAAMAYSAAHSGSTSKYGKGEYALKVRGDGRAYLWELLNDNTWISRFSFSWNDNPSPVSWVSCFISVIPRMWQDDSSHYLGDRLTFTYTSVNRTPGNNQFIENLADTAVTAIRASAKAFPIYRVPRLDPTAATSPAPVRIDIARDCRASFNASRHIYKATGYIVDDFVPFDQAVSTANDIYLYVHGVVPSGTSIDLIAYDENGASLTRTSGVTVVNGTRGQIAWASFTPTNRQRYAKVKVALTANTDKSKTSTLYSYGLYRSPIYDSTNPLSTVTVPNLGTNIPRTVIESLQIHPQGADPGAASATFTVCDLTGELSFLGNRNMIPVLARTRYDGTGTHYADLFRGYIVQASSARFRGPSSKIFPAQTATRYTLECVGEWARASETLNPSRMSWSNSTTGSTWKVTDVIRYVAQTVYPASMVDVPDEATLLKSEDPTTYMYEVNAKAVDTMQTLASEFFGGYMLFDESAGTKGMLRMLLQKHAPYNNLAVFEIDHPTALAGDGVPRLPHYAGSYATTTVSGQTIQHTPIIAGTMRGWNEKAEGNCVVVTGGAINEDANAAGVPAGAQICQTAINVGSYNFLGLSALASGYPDGSSPEYYGRIVPIKVVDWKLSTQEMVNWKARRVYEKACFARFYVTFQAPMILVTDVTDASQVRPRPLRFYDPVQVRNVDGSLTQWLVLSCVPSFSKDHMGMATYTLVTQSNISTIGAIDTPNNMLRTVTKMLNRLTGSNWNHSRPTAVQQKSLDAMTSRLVSLPVPTALPIQDLDNTSGTFGQFINMSSFDAIPHS